MKEREKIVVWCGRPRPRCHARAAIHARRIDVTDDDEAADDEHALTHHLYHSSIVFAVLISLALFVILISPARVRDAVLDPGLSRQPTQKTTLQERANSRSG